MNRETEVAALASLSDAEIYKRLKQLDFLLSPAGRGQTPRATLRDEQRRLIAEWIKRVKQ